MTQTATIQVLSRAAAILRACRDGEGLSLADIAQRVGLPRSTVQRIVRSLAIEGLLAAGSTARGIRLGPGIHALAAASRFDMVEFAHPYLKALSARLGETVDLAVLRSDHMVFIDQIAGSHRLRAVSAVGEKFPLHCTANGKAALAMLGDAAIREVCAGKLEAHTPATIRSMARLRKEIGRVRTGGLAFELPTAVNTTTFPRSSSIKFYKLFTTHWRQTRSLALHSQSFELTASLRRIRLCFGVTVRWS